MTSVRLLTSAFVAISLASTAAMAGGPTTPAPEAPVAAAPMATALDWSGFYLGLGGAIAMGDNTIREETGGETTAGDWDGTVPYAVVGYDWQAGNIVYGAALDLSFGSFDAFSTPNGSFSCSDGICRSEVSNFASLRGRVGYSLGSALLYGTAGFARADAEGGFGSPVVSGSDTMNGWVAGVGVEFRATERLSIDASYMHADLGTLALPLSCGTNCSTDIDFGQLRIGANLRW